jgi:hypothetical protein
LSGYVVRSVTLIGGIRLGVVTGGRCRSGGFAKELFLDEFTQDVAERDVTFLNPGRDR